MKRYLADVIIPGKGRPVENGILLINDEGKIIQLIHPGDSGYEPANAMYFEGALVPGFVNAHLHLELSHFKDLIPRGTGIDNFVERLRNLRQEGLQPDELLLEKTDRDMHAQGVVAAGDICNTSRTFDVKSRSKIRYHNFIELFAFRPERAEQVFQQGLKLQQIAHEKGLTASISPHAPYSASELLMQLISNHIDPVHETLSIHFQESEEEIEFITTGGGSMAQRMSRMGINSGGYRPNPAGPPGWLKNTIPKSQRLLTVHNTFSSPKETDALHAHFHNIWFCTCPSANLYITGIIPRRETLLSSADRWCIGTDSLASNNALDILQEMRILQETHEFNLEKLIPMATLHGACALGLDSELGSFEPGKKPGIVHLSNVNYKELLILPETRSCLI